MARPKAGYRLKDGTRVPGSTTIGGMMKDAEPLMFWAWKEGSEGRDYRESRGKAAGAGTIIHEKAEAFVHGDDPDMVVVPPEVEDQVGEGFRAFLDWAEQTRLEIVETEQALVSEKYRYGGTFDAIAYCGGKLSLCDWKTGSGIYPEVVLQLASYRELINETMQDPIEVAHVVRFNRDSGAFSHTSIPSSVLDIGWNAFLHCRELYEIRKVLKKSL